jgi:hypothetical protein
MSTAIKIWGWTALCCVLAGTAAAQPPAAPTPAAPVAPAAKPSPGTAQSEAGEPRADTSGVAAPDPKAARHAAAGAASGVKPAAKTDRLDLGLATVTGDHEQPKVLYIVPWKRSDIGDLQGKPMNSLVDEILAPVDRDVFRREVVYYQAVQADASQNGARGVPAPQGEK